MTLQTQLSTLETSGLIRLAQMEPELEYLFRHALIQDAAYESILKADRRILHRAIGETLERLYPEQLTELAPTLGQHFAEAGENEKAAKYLLMAGDQASAIYAYPEAIAYYERALPFLKEVRRAARTYMKLGLLYHALFDFQRSRQAYEAGFALWQRLRETPADSAWPPAPHALRTSWGGQVVLDAATAAYSSSLDIIEHLFSGLVERNAELDIFPDVAQRWEVLEGGRKYIFYLRADVRWSDGRQVTAGDFEYAWKRVLDPATGSSMANLLYDIHGARAYHQGQVSTADNVGVQALDALTLSVELEAPTGYFLSLLACPSLFPVPRWVVEAHGAAWTDVNYIVTNGPFQLAEWRKGHFLRLARNLSYHGQFGGNVQYVEVFIYKKIHEILKAYELGHLDVCFLSNFPLPAETGWEQHRWAGEHLSPPGSATMFIAFDPSRPPFNNPQVRRAFVLAVNRETVAEEILKGYYSPALGGLVPPGIPGHSAGIGLPYDPEQARQLLAEAGYPGGQGFPTVDALAVDGPSDQLVEYVTTQWREILGVRVAWESVGEEAFGIRIKDAPPHLCWAGWVADYPDPDNFLRVARSYYFPWSWNLVYDNLVEGARHIADQETRIRLCQAADHILIEDAVVFPISYERFDVLIKPWVRQYPLSGLATFWKDVVIEPH